ncbi:DUF7459 domain-containing protein [Mycolicibacterium septicum]
MSDATPCEHHQVYNETWRCTECGEKMISRHDEPQYLLAGSSPKRHAVPRGIRSDLRLRTLHLRPATPLRPSPSRRIFERCRQVTSRLT